MCSHGESYLLPFLQKKDREELLKGYITRDGFVEVDLALEILVLSEFSEEDRLVLASLLVEESAFWERGLERYYLTSNFLRMAFAETAVLSSFYVVAKNVLCLTFEEVDRLKESLSIKRAEKFLYSAFWRDLDSVEKGRLLNLTCMYHPTLVLELPLEFESFFSPCVRVFCHPEKGIGGLGEIPPIFKQFVQKDAEGQLNALRWVAYCSLLHQVYFDQSMSREFLDTLQAISKLHPLTLRYKACRILFQALSAQKESLRSIERGCPVGRAELRVGLLPIQSEALQQEIIRVFSGSAYKDNAIRSAILDGFLGLWDVSLPIESTEELLEVAFRSEDPFACFYLIKSIYGLGGAQLLLEAPPNTIDDMRKIATESLAIVFEIGDREGFRDKMEVLLRGARNPDVFFTLASKFNQLNLLDRPLVLSALKKLVESLLDKTWPTVRYERGEHLSVVFAGREELEMAWKQGKSIPYSKSVASEESSAVLFEEIVNHLKENLSENLSEKEYPYLCEIMKGNPLDESRLVILNQELKSASIGKDSQKLLTLSLQKALCLLLKSPDLRAQRQIFLTLLKGSCIPKMEQCELKQALEELGRRFFIAKELRTEGWTIVDTDNWEDLLLCGTEVADSCLSVYGDPNTLKCLPAYAIDGKNRLFAVKDEKEKIVARCIVRILWDAEGLCPVLFKERVYSAAHVDPRIVARLDRFCLERAEELRSFALSPDRVLPFVSPEDSYPSPLLSLGGAPFEYADIGGGIMENGVFQVHLGGLSDELV